MLELENMTGKHEVMHHPTHGIMRRPMWEKRFTKLQTKTIPRADFELWEVVDYRDVPKELIQPKPTMAGTDIFCSKCNEHVAYTESADGMCRGCYMGDK